jgi:hypothetical protein
VVWVATGCGHLSLAVAAANKKAPRGNAEGLGARPGVRSRAYVMAMR